MDTVPTRPLCQGALVCRIQDGVSGWRREHSDRPSGDSAAAIPTGSPCRLVPRYQMTQRCCVGVPVDSRCGLVLGDVVDPVLSPRTDPPRKRSCSENKTDDEEKRKQRALFRHRSNQLHSLRDAGEGVSWHEVIDVDRGGYVGACCPVESLAHLQWL